MYGIKGQNSPSINADVFIYDKNSGALLKTGICTWNGSYSVVVSNEQVEVDVVIKPNVSIQKMSNSKTRSNGSAVVYGDKMYVFAGNTTAIDNDLWEYNVTNDSWTQKGLSSPPSVRYAHSASEANGKMYVFGGHSGSAYIDQMYEYDIANNTWTYKGTSGTARMNHNSVHYNGSIYIYGGNNASYLSSMQAYNIAGNSWSNKASSSQLSEYTAVVYNDKMYVFGGYEGGSSRTNELKSYTFSSNQWASVSYTGRPPCARSGHSAVVIGTKMYIIGGSTPYRELNDIWAFDFTNSTWQLICVLTKTKWRGVAGAYNNKIYIHSGYDEGTQANTTYMVDPINTYSNHSKSYKNVRTEFVAVTTTNTVTPTPTPSQTYRHTTCLYNNKLYVHGGIVSGSASAATLEYDINTNASTSKTSYGTATYASASAMSGDKMYVYGGNNASNNAVGNMRYYSITNDNWTEKTAGQTRFEHTLVTYGNKMYTFGGAINTTAQSTLYEYDIVNDSWTQKASGPSARYRHLAKVYGSKMYVFGGTSTGSDYFAELWAYDLVNNTWEQKASNTVGLYNNLSFIYNDTLYVLNGSYSGGYNRTTYKYSFANNTWSDLGSSTCISLIRADGFLATNNNFYAFCGFNGAALTTVSIFTP